MVIVYLDTSVAMKLLVEESRSVKAASFLSAASGNGDIIISSMLLFTELHCAANRRSEIPRESVNELLQLIDLIDVTRSDFLYAAAMPGHLRSGDAIHLAAAIRAEADRIATYDKELSDAARTAGLATIAP